MITYLNNLYINEFIILKYYLENFIKINFFIYFLLKNMELSLIEKLAISN